MNGNIMLAEAVRDIARTFGVVDEAVTLRFRLDAGSPKWTVEVNLGDGEVMEGSAPSLHEASLNARHRKPMTIDDAPIHYTNEEAHAWLAGCEHGRENGR